MFLVVVLYGTGIIHSGDFAALVLIREKQQLLTEKSISVAHMVAYRYSPRLLSYQMKVKMPEEKYSTLVVLAANSNYKALFQIKMSQYHSYTMSEQIGTNHSLV